MNIEQEKINGLNTLFIHSPGSKSSSVQIWFRAGSALEVEDNEGIAHFLEHMFFKGTPTHPGAQLARHVESFGGEVNAFTSFDYTCYYINSPHSKVAQSAELVLDMVSNPLFSADEIPAERGVVFEEYRRSIDNPSQYHFMELQKKFFTAGYAHPILGREETIKNFSQEQIKNFRQANYNLKNAMFVVAGDLTQKDQLKELIGRFTLPDGEQSQFPVFALKTSPEVMVHEKPVRQATLNICFQAPDYTSEEASAQDLFLSCLAHGETSRLYQNLVMKNALCNVVSGSTMYFAHQGIHFLRLNFPEENLAKVLAKLHQEMLNLLTHPFSEEEVEKIKNQYIASKVYEKESIEAYAFSLGHGFAQNGNIFCEDEFINKMKLTSASQVNRALSDFLEKTMHLSMQVPLGSKIATHAKTLKAFQKKLKTLKPIKRNNHKTIKSKFDPETKLIKMAPGVELIYRRCELTPTFVFHAYLRGGISQETQKTCGQHYLLSKLLTYGYEKLSYEKLKKDLEFRSASLSGFSGRNAYGLTLHGQTKDFNNLTQHFFSTLLKPSLPQKYLAHEKKLTLRFLDGQEEDPVKQCFKNFNKIVYQGHHYAYDLTGTKESLKKINAEGLQKLHKKRLKQEPLLLTYCGNLTLHEVIETITPYLEKLKKKETNKTQIKKVQAYKRQSFHLDMKREQTQIVIGTKAYGITSKEDTYLKMISSYLSGQSSDLFVEVRDHQGLCYAVQPIHISALEAGCWGIYIGAGNDKKEAAITAIKKILKGLADKGISEKEFKRIKLMLDGQHQMGLQTNDDYAHFYSIYQLHGLGLDFQHQAHQKVLECKYDDFQKFLKKFFKQDWSIVTVGS